MHRRRAGGFRSGLVGLFAAVALGCAGKTFDYQPTAGEMKRGPGVFSGEPGEFTVYDSARKDPPREGTKEPLQEGSTQEHPQTRLSPAEAREFREFQEWKESAKDSAEYREFQEWREWKSYQEWKNRQE